MHIVTTPDETCGESFGEARRTVHVRRKSVTSYEDAHRFSLKVLAAARPPDNHLCVTSRARTGAKRLHIALSPCCEHSSTRLVEERVGEGRLQLTHPLPEFVDEVFEIDNPADALEAQAFSAELGNRAKLGNIAERIASRVPARSLRYDKSEPIVLAQRLWVHFGEISGSRNGEHWGVLIHLHVLPLGLR